jgi:hypothetical protein
VMHLAALARVYVVTLSACMLHLADFSTPAAQRQRGLLIRTMAATSLSCFNFISRALFLPLLAFTTHLPKGYPILPA